MAVQRKSTEFGLAALAVFLPMSAWSQATTNAEPRPDQTGGSQAHAQNSTTQSSSGSSASSAVSVEEIIVTATRTETRLQDTPVAITALSATSLAERNVSTLLDVANFVPDLSIGTRAGAGTSSGAISIRGMGVNANQSSAAVGVYVDDVYFASSQGNLLGLLDVQRVEVLRGPQGTLFGRNTIAGAIQYVTVAPGKDLDGYATATYGTFARNDFSGAINIPITDTLAVRAAGFYEDRGGYILDELNSVQRGAEKYYGGRLRARWTPVDRLTVDLKGEMLVQSSNGRPVLVTAVNNNAQFVGLAQLFGLTTPFTSDDLSKNNRSFPGYNAPDYSRSTFVTTNADISYYLSDAVTLKSITSYSWYRNRFAADFDQTPLPILATSAGIDNTGVLTQELQMRGKFFQDFLGLTSGVYYYDSHETNDPNSLLTFGLAPPANANGNPSTSIRAVALYSQATLNFTDQFSADAGLRYSNERNTSYLIGQTSPNPVSFNDVSPSAGLNFKATQDILLYVKASKGFRAGGVVPNAAIPGGAFDFRPETAWTYEAGARFAFFDRRLRINPTAFLTVWNNIQFNRLVPTPTTVALVTDNAGDARIKGFELESQFDVTSRLQLTGSLSWLEGHYTRVDPLTYSTYPFGFLASLPNPVTGQVLPGSTVILPNLTLDTPLQQAPKVKYSIGGRYTVPLTNGAQITANTNFAWTAWQQANLTISDSMRLPAYGLLNARLEFTSPSKRYSVGLFGTNLTNKFYLLGGTGFGKGYTTGADQVDPARPRELGIDARVNF